MRANKNGQFDDVSLIVEGAGEPTNQAELAAQKAAEDKKLEDAYQAWFNTLTPEHQARERILQQNLGGFYLPLHKKNKVAGTANAWDYVKDDPALPRILIIGDSISRGYTMAVRKALEGEVNVHRAPENCGPTGNGLRKLDIWLNGENWDLITFNFGIHDRRTKSEDYAKALETIIKKLQGTGAQLVWVNTTPVPEGANEYVEGASERVNEVSSKIMEKHAIPTVDLYHEVEKVPQEGRIEKNCHFREQGYQILGACVAEHIRKQLKQKKQ